MSSLFLLKRMIDASAGSCIKFSETGFKKKHSFFLDKALRMDKTRVEGMSTPCL